MRERDTSEPDDTVMAEPPMRADLQNVPSGGPIYELLGFRSAEQAAALLWNQLKQAD